MLYLELGFSPLKYLKSGTGLLIQSYVLLLSDTGHFILGMRIAPSQLL